VAKPTGRNLNLYDEGVFIIVCGMRRSGSTLTFQVTRALLELENQITVTEPQTGIGVAVEEIASVAASDEILLTKMHTVSKSVRDHLPKTGAKYIYTARDPRDAVASLIRKGRLSKSDPSRAEFVKDFAKKERIGSLIYPKMPTVWCGFYEDFVDDLPSLIKSLAEFLEISVTDKWILDLSEELDINKQKERSQSVREDFSVRQQTRLTVNHITDGRPGSWRETLLSHEVQIIENQFIDWMLRNGYRPTTFRLPKVKRSIGKRIVRRMRWIKSVIIYSFSSMHRG
jgi:hypothetical protein